MKLTKHKNRISRYLESIPEVYDTETDNKSRVYVTMSNFT